jgi:hypothetical protein
MTNEQLYDKAYAIVRQLRALGADVQCWSVKGSGKATKDCDIAIDAYKVPDDFPRDASQIDPYENGETGLVRLKYNIT